MKQSRKTKLALLTSVLSMLLCMTMLVGSTFAWFVDSVTSDKNKIVAGNLDVVLEYSTDGANWQKVTETTNMFQEGALWEPGYTEVVYLRVTNAGTLALKYHLGINVANKVIGQTADGTAIDLSEYIMFSVGEITAPYANRDVARAAVQDSAQPISVGYSSAEDGHLAVGQKSATIALVVYMPEDVSNASNHGTDKTAPAINLGIKLTAAQDTVEKDSFNDQYDAGSEYPTPEEIFVEMLNQGGSQSLVEDVNIGSQKILTMPDATVLDMNGRTVSDANMDLILQGKNVAVKNGTFQVLNGGSYALFVGDVGETDNFVIENVIMYGGVNVYNASNVILRNCEIHAANYYAVWADCNAHVIIESGTYYNNGTMSTLLAFDGNPTKGEPAGSIIVKGGSFSDDPTPYVDTTAYDVTLDPVTNMYVVTPKN